MCGLRGAVWISILDKLACKSEDQTYVLTTLDGTDSAVLALPEKNNLLALTYVADQNILVFVERRSSLFGGRDKWDVWAHDFASGINHLLAKNQYLGLRAVYLED